MAGADPTITTANLADAEAIREVQVATWMATYPNPELGISAEDIRRRCEGRHGERIEARLAKWRAEITAAKESEQVFVARVDGRVIGFSVAIIRYGRRRVSYLYVLPAYHHKGIGAQLMQAALDWCGNFYDVFLEVVCYNQPAISFYKRFGFVETGKKVKDVQAVRLGEKQLPRLEMKRLSSAGKQ